MESLSLKKELEKQVKKLPLKRRDLKASIREKYSSVVSSPVQKDLEEFQSHLASHVLESVESSSRRRRIYLSPEEREIANKIENNGIKQFKDTLNMYNKFHKNRLFEPDEDPHSHETYHKFMKSIIPERYKPQISSSPYLKTPTSPTKSFSGLKNVIKPVEEFSTEKIPSSLNVLKPAIDFSMLKQRRGNITKKEVIAVPDIGTETGNITQMKEMSSSLKSGEPLSKEAKKFLNIIRNNAQLSEVEEMLEKSPNLVNVSDNVIIGSNPFNVHREKKLPCTGQ